MPTCRKCNTKFPNWESINGKRKNLSSRKYCLTCSPYKGHNTSNLEVYSTSSNSCICKECGKSYTYKRKKGGTKNICNSCNTKKQRINRKQLLVDYKGGKCEVCGYNKSLRALHFHHFDKKTKKFSISGQHCRKLLEVKKEVDKCILLCSNCHAEEHDRLESI